VQELFTVIKLLGEGSFAAVFLCDWHGVPGPPEPPYGVRINRGAEQSGMRLVAVKKMKRKWEHNRNEYENLKEVKVE
jgi:serine/threonine protein kinase